VAIEAVAACGCRDVTVLDGHPLTCLSHLGLPTEIPTARPARPPPLPIGRPETWYDDVVASP
jgi:hypothetical protein